MSKETGGAAFPSEYRIVAEDQTSPVKGYKAVGAQGMDLRDYFAGQAMCGILANYETNRLAEKSYEYADALIAERNKNE